MSPSIDIRELPDVCPLCGAQPFDPFLRGIVARSARPWWAPWRKRAAWAVICHRCMEIVGYEHDRRLV
jgi:hypothetical protein